MMNKFINSLAILVVLLTSSLTFANTQKKSEISVCPNAKLFKMVAFDTIQEGDHPGVWTFTQNGHTYKTPYKWKFSLMIDAKNKKIALRKAKLSLSNLSKVRGPHKVGTAWFCDYKSKSALDAAAIYTP